MLEVAGIALAPVLGPIDFTVPRAGCWWLVGASGAGKSLLLESLAGMHAQASGSIRVNGSEVAHLAPEERGITLMPQRWRLFPHWDVAQNLRFAARLGNVPWNDVQELGERLHVRSLFGRPAEALSGGETQRIALLQTLLSPARVLLLDEPLSAIDRSLQSLVLQLLEQRARESNRICLIAAHRAMDAHPLQGKYLVEAGKLSAVTARRLPDQPLPANVGLP